MEQSYKAKAESKFTYEPYNQQGRAYIEAQREFYPDTPDTARVFFRKVLEPNIRGKTLVDIGCGAGDDLISYKKMGATRVIGVEPSITMLEMAKETVKESGLPIDLLQGEWSHIPLKDESADIVTARYSLHIIPKFEKAFTEVARVLKKDGQFFFAVPHPKHDAQLVKEQNTQPGKQIKSFLFGGKVVVENFPHTIEDYLSELALKYFILEDKHEYSMEEDSGETEPTGLVINFRKK